MHDLAERYLLALTALRQSRAGDHELADRILALETLGAPSLAEHTLAVVDVGALLPLCGTNVEFTSLFATLTLVTRIGFEHPSDLRLLDCYVLVGNLIVHDRMPLDTLLRKMPPLTISSGNRVRLQLFNRHTDPLIIGRVVFYGVTTEIEV